MLDYLKQLSNSSVHFIYKDIAFYPKEILTDDIIEFIVEASNGKVSQFYLESLHLHEVKNAYKIVYEGLQKLEFSLQTISKDRLGQCIDFIIKSNLNIKGFFIKEMYIKLPSLTSSQQELFKYIYETAKIKIMIKNIENNIKNIGYYF